MSEQEEFTEQDDARASIHQVSHIQPENPDIHETSSGSTELYTAPCINLNEERTRAKHQMVERESPPLEKKKKDICTEDEAFEHIDDEFSSSPSSMINLPNTLLFGPQAHQSNVDAAFKFPTQRKRKLSGDDNISPHVKKATGLTSYNLRKHTERYILHATIIMYMYCTEQS